jgi:hypothetical protein
LQQNNFSSQITGFFPQSCPQCIHSAIPRILLSHKNIKN